MRKPSAKTYKDLLHYYDKEYETNNYKVKVSGTNNYKCLVYYINKY